jgi:hypothetical protein
MQTAQIKPGAVYAYERGDRFVRFHVDAIITRKAADATKSVIEGYIVEDHKGGTPALLKVEPGKLDGPYDQRMELVKRQEQEAADKKAAEIAKKKQAEQDRLTLYAFVGEEPPNDATAYHQLFRISFGSIDLSNEGQRRLIEAIRGKMESNNVKA